MNAPTHTHNRDSYKNTQVYCGYTHFFWSTNHCWRKSGVFRMRDAILAPWMGGLEYMGRMRIFTWDITRLASSLDWHTMVKAPTRSPETITWCSRSGGSERNKITIAFVLLSPTALQGQVLSNLFILKLHFHRPMKPE